MAEYTYDKSDTLNNVILTDALDYEIRISSLSSGALSNFDGLRVDDGYDIYVFFTSSLSGADESILDAVIAAHPGTSIPAYEEFIYSGNIITNIITWESSLKEDKLSEEQYTYTNNKVSQVVTIVYNPDGTEYSRVTEDLTLSGNNIESNTITES